MAENKNFPFIGEPTRMSVAQMNAGFAGALAPLIGGIMPLGLIGRACVGCQCQGCRDAAQQLQARRFPAWSPRTLAGTNDAATAMSQVLDQLREQMRNTPRRDRRPVRPNTYWQFANGKIGVPDTFLDLTEMKVYRAWDRGLGAFVTYAA